MRVLMIDDHMLVLQGVQTLLAVLAPTIAVDTASDLDAALRLLAERRHDLVLLDWHLDGQAGEETITRLRAAGCAARIVVLSGDDSPLLVHRAVELGACGFLPKRLGSEQMLTALRTVLDGGIYLPPGGMPDLPPRSPRAVGASARERLASLTARQAEIYRAAARGVPNKLIAREFGIAESTVKSHLATAFGVMGVRNRSEAAWQAAREGLLLE